MKLLNKIQQELKAPKGQFNSFGKYKYRSCEDILEAVKPLLGNGTLTLTDEIVMLGDRFYVKATALLHDGENEITVHAYAREAFDKKGMDDSQITGAASSYARKYALNGLFLIDDTKDADSQDNTPEAPKLVSKPTQPAKPVESPYQLAVRYINTCTTQEEIADTEKKITDSEKLNDKEKAELLIRLDERAQLVP